MGFLKKAWKATRKAVKQTVRYGVNVQLSHLQPVKFKHGLPHANLDKVIGNTGSDVVTAGFYAAGAYGAGAGVLGAAGGGVLGSRISGGGVSASNLVGFLPGTGGNVGGGSGGFFGDIGGFFGDLSGAIHSGQDAYNSLFGNSSDHGASAPPTTSSGGLSTGQWVMIAAGGALVLYLVTREH